MQPVNIDGVILMLTVYSTVDGGMRGLCCRGCVYLSNLLHPVDMTRLVRLVSERGDVVGHINVAVLPVTGMSLTRSRHYSCPSTTAPLQHSRLYHPHM